MTILFGTAIPIIDEKLSVAVSDLVKFRGESESQERATLALGMGSSPSAPALSSLSLHALHDTRVDSFQDA